MFDPAAFYEEYQDAKCRAAPYHVSPTVLVFLWEGEAREATCAGTGSLISTIRPVLSSWGQISSETSVCKRNKSYVPRGCPEGYRAWQDTSLVLERTQNKKIEKEEIQLGGTDAWQLHWEFLTQPMVTQSWWDAGQGENPAVHHIPW